MSKRRKFSEKLGLGENAPVRLIKDAFRKMAKLYHPDAHSDGDGKTENFQEINEAYHYLLENRPARPGRKFKFAAILSADMVGYSRMMATDERATLRILARSKEVFEERVREFRGRIFNTAGDAILAEFGNVFDVVRCAVEIQKEFQEQSANQPRDWKIRFRVGLNSGDVFIQDDDLLGDTVNLAARLQTAAPPGGICISGNIFEQINSRFPISFAFLGERRFKNIPNPIPTYAVTELEGGIKLPWEQPLQKPWAVKRIALSALLVSVLAIGAMAASVSLQNRDLVGLKRRISGGASGPDSSARQNQETRDEDFGQPSASLESFPNDTRNLNGAFQDQKAPNEETAAPAEVQSKKADSSELKHPAGSVVSKSSTPAREMPNPAQASDVSARAALGSTGNAENFARPLKSKLSLQENQFVLSACRLTESRRNPRRNVGTLEPEVENTVKSYAEILRRDVIHSVNLELSEGTEKRIQALISPVAADKFGGNDAERAVLKTISSATIAPMVKRVVVGNLNEALQGMAREDFKKSLAKVFADFLKEKISESTNDPKQQMERLHAMKDRLPNITRDLGRPAREKMLQNAICGLVESVVLQGGSAAIEGNEPQIHQVDGIMGSVLISIENSLDNSALNSLIAGNRTEELVVPGSFRQLPLSESLEIKARASAAISFHLSEPQRIRLNVVGLLGTEKGFTVQVHPIEEAAPEAAMGVSRTLDLPAGNYSLSVTNSENILRAMSVNVTLTLDPR